MAVERLEGRRLLAVYTVDSTADVDQRNTALTLREAVNVVNGTDTLADLTQIEREHIDATQPIGTNDQIKFNIFGSGVQTITLGSDLTVSKAVTIDGYTQPGASAATDSTAAKILIAIDGGYPHGGTIKFTGNNITLRGVAAGDTVGSVITLSGTSDTIAGDYIGVGADGSSSFGGTGFGISVVNGGTDDLIGGLTAADRNVISDSNGGQIGVNGGYATTIEGNYIGTTVDGNAAFQTFVEYENNYGISVTGGSSGTFIGGVAPGARNVISGNTLGGILIGDPGQTIGAGNVQVKGNYIGTNAAGTAAVENYEYGITVQGSINITIGGTTPAERNVISGNGQDGLLLTGVIGYSVDVQGNYIGTNAAGTAAVPNGVAGIAVTASNYTIGGTDPGAGNLISGNTNVGIQFDARNVDELTHESVEGNYIGTNAAGTAAVANGDFGIEVLGTEGTDNNPDTSIQVTIGGVTAAARNVISGNGFYGIDFADVSGDNVVEGNYIGVDATGMAVLGNGQDGIFIEGGAFGHATNVVVGGIVAGAGNVISGNGIDGILIAGDQNAVLGNLIGVLADGTTAAGNFGTGVAILGASNNVVGGSLAAANVIANNHYDGVYITDSFGGGNGYASQDGVRFNSIFNNAELGINLNLTSPGVELPPVTLNDPGDTDFGGNDFQNFPLLSAATSDGKSVTVNGYMSSAANRTYLVDVYANAVANASGYGEGKQYLGTTTVTTGDDGTANFTATFNVAIGGNVYLSSTATTVGPIGETSEFGPTITVSTTTPPPPAAPSVSINDLSQNEGNSGVTPFTFTLTRTGDLTTASTVSVSTSDGTATAGIDYAALNGTQVTFAAGQATATVTVNVVGDTTVEANETFNVVVSAVTNATIGDGAGLGTIVNDDVAPPPPVAPTVSINNVSQNEGNAGTTAFTFTLTRTGDLTNASVVTVTTADGTATAGSDYAALAGTLVAFAAGQATATVTVNVNGDTTVESNETFTVSLASSSNATIDATRGSGTGTIVNDDATVTPPTPVQLGGTAFGTSGSFLNRGNTFANVFDGKLNTFFDGPTANGDVVGLDFGGAQTVTSIKYAPRAGFESRMVGGVIQASNTADFSSLVTLLKITAAPVAGTLTTATVSNAGAYRYVRYVAPNGSFGNVAELQFFGTPGTSAPPTPITPTPPVTTPTTPTKLSGTTIGTAGSFGNAGNTIAKATNGSLSTFFDGPTANGNFVGLDLGAAKVIKQIAYAPRNGFAARMVGGLFQGSNSADFSNATTLLTITATPTQGALTTVPISNATAYRYVRYLSPNGSFGNVSEIAFYG